MPTYLIMRYLRPGAISSTNFSKLQEARPPATQPATQPDIESPTRSVNQNESLQVCSKQNHSSTETYNTRVWSNTRTTFTCQISQHSDQGDCDDGQLLASSETPPQPDDLISKIRPCWLTGTPPLGPAVRCSQSPNHRRRILRSNNCIRWIEHTHKLASLS